MRVLQVFRVIKENENGQDGNQRYTKIINIQITFKFKMEPLCHQNNDIFASTQKATSVMYTK